MTLKLGLYWLFAGGRNNDGFYVTGGHPENSDISTATTSAFYSGGGFYVSSGWTYDLRLIRGPSMSQYG